MGKSVLGTGGYNKRLMERAARTGAMVRSSRGNAIEARVMHRDSLLRWADPKAVDEEKRTITDPRKLVPYRGKSFATGLKALMTYLKSAEVKNMDGQCSKDFSQILEWAGSRNKEFDGVAATPWVWVSDLYKRACKLLPSLPRSLRERQDDRPGVKDENRTKNPLEKFCGNIRTIQRDSGTRKYAEPLHDTLYAIDSRFRKNKRNRWEIQFRLVIGRWQTMKERKPTVRKTKVKASAKKAASAAA